MKYYRFGEYRQVQVTVSDEATEQEAREIFEQRKENTKFTISIKEVNVKKRGYEETEIDRSFFNQYKKSSRFILLNDMHGLYLNYCNRKGQNVNAGKMQFLKMSPFKSMQKRLLNTNKENSCRWTIKKIILCSK